MTKMALFYKDMTQGHYEQVNANVQRRFLSLTSELGDESRIRFVFYTSAPQSGIQKKRVEKKSRDLFSDSSQFDVALFFGSDLEDEIKESESRRPTVESGKIKIDESDNYLLYGDNAAKVNRFSEYIYRKTFDSNCYFRCRCNCCNTFSPQRILDDSKNREAFIFLPHCWVGFPRCSINYCNI